MVLAIYIKSGIVVEDSARVFFVNNFAFQGSALCVIPSSFTIEVRCPSSVQFINNTALEDSDMQSAAPCLFMVTDYTQQKYLLLETMQGAESDSSIQVLYHNWEHHKPTSLQITVYQFRVYCVDKT